MTDCTQEWFHFPRFDRRKIEASLTGSDGGLLLFSSAYSQQNLFRQVSQRLSSA